MTARHLAAWALACAALAAMPRPAGAAITTYYDRAAWQAALSGVAVRDVNAVTADVNLSTVGATATVGDLTFQRVLSPLNGSGGSIFLLADGTNGRAIDGTPFLYWSGTTGSQPYTLVTLPTAAFGVGVDWNAPSPSSDSDRRPHNSFYFDVTGNSGRLANGGRIGGGFLVNDEDLFGVGNVPKGGFFGVIDDQGGITSFRVGSVWTNFQAFGVDNFSFATGLAGTATAVPDPGTLALVGAGLAGVCLARRRR